jgi:hypothetical protein
MLDVEYWILNKKQVSPKAVLVQRLISSIQNPLLQISPATGIKHVGNALFKQDQSGL